jgi:Mg-chelatase subunit ChlD
VPKSDFVFIIDCSISMAGEIAAVRSGLSGFVAGLAAFNVDPRFAIVLFGGEPELVLDFTSNVP